MCGICGKLDFHGQEINDDLLKRMTDSFSYRGPDDSGIYNSHPVGLGHRRLSIIDLSSSGHQPMSNEDESIWLVFNGEIYDFHEHRSLLEKKGHRLKSQTDCETIIHLYEEAGTGCLDDLNGMFAFALWDGRNRQLWLVRDRLGIKPLYYYWDGRILLFASEIKAILCDPDVRREIDMAALDLYLTLNYIPAPWTIFKNIRKLLPGNHLLAKEQGIHIEPYWDIPSDTGPSMPLPENGNQPDDYRQRLYSLLENAVKRRLISDVPLGAFLSGGIDSSIIVGLMARNSSRPVKTFSIGYKDIPSFDETRYALEVAEFNNTDHREFKLGYRDILEAFPAVLENMDEPFADSSAVPTYIVSQKTRDHVTVALSGDGGDELFAGYRMYQGERFSRYYGLLPPFIRNRLIAPVINSLPDARDRPSLEMARRLKKFVKGMSNSFIERFCVWREVFPYSLRQELLREPQKENLWFNMVSRMVEREDSPFPNDNINLMLYMDVKGLLPNDMLTKVDRMSMANSLEVRVPLLDHTLVEYAFQLKGDVKLRGKTGKYILMETFRDLLPSSLHKRPKSGFEMPIGAWLRNDLKFLIDEYLDRDLIKGQGIFNFEIIDGLIKAHMRKRRDTSWHLWNLIVFQHWHRRYL
ncbi:asparagine synthase (glutamine-hydrolyzing) [Deltaproteobacteria bacterium]|nr:asparagine synthase (glutamine-hydrolyzing) [Deltaproteobacteria bacterium]